jgi:molecular chaperone GrpE (heat shock protein)
MAGDEEERSLTNEPEVAAPEETGGDGDTKNSEEKGTRFDNAKAFFRALNAGAEVTPDEFGINVGEPPGAGPGDRGGGPCMNCKALDDARVAAEAKASEHEKLYKRMAADFENYKKRIDREREEFKDQGVEKTLKDILPALDDLDRAVSHFDESSDPKTVLESLTLVYNRFLSCFEQLGAKPLQVVGQLFDPRMHEPVQQIETNDIPEGHVASELRRGYSYKDKIVRPSLVNVATPVTAAAPTASSQEEEAEEPIYEANEGGEPQGEQAAEQWVEDATEGAELNAAQNQEEIHEGEAVRAEGEEASETVV